jgi:hypothetical protein
VHGAVLSELRTRNKIRLAGDLNKLRRLRERADYHLEANYGHSSEVCPLCDENKRVAKGDVVNVSHWQQASRIAPGLIALLHRF